MSKKYKGYESRLKDTATLKEVVDELLDTYKIRGKYNEANLLNSWESIMGKSIASRTTKIYIHNRKLFVQLNSAPLKSELNLAKSKVLDLLLKEIGVQVVEDVVFL